MEKRDDIRYMLRCLHLARLAEGDTSPNPMVGSVIVHKGLIIGEGYHQRAGEPHAEVNAINSVEDKTLLKDSTLYVNLEPCSHHGRTPPCAELIVRSGIPRVVIGSIDTSAKVGGKGIALLRNSGCEVVTGILEKESRELNRRFFTYNEKGRPYIVLKWAASADGFLDRERLSSDPAGPNWITGDHERALVHRWRSEEDAVMVGGRTVRIDNPQLNVREWHGKDPVKVVVSGSADLDPASAIFTSGGRVILFTNAVNCDLPNISLVNFDKERPIADQICHFLHEEGFLSVLIEGGASLLTQFLDSGLWDEIRVFEGVVLFGSGLKAPVPRGELVASRNYRDSTLSCFRNNHSLYQKFE